MILGANGQAPGSDYTPRSAYSRSRERYDTCLGEEIRSWEQSLCS